MTKVKNIITMRDIKFGGFTISKIATNRWVYGDLIRRDVKQLQNK